MSFTAVFHENRNSKVHFSEYLVDSSDDEDTTSPEPHQPEQPEAE